MIMELTYEEKKKKLLEIFRELTDENVAVAFSGGVDSSVILKLAVESGKDSGVQVYAYTAKTELHEAKDIKEACNIAMEIGAKHEVISIDELRDAGIENNPKDRCYLCKKLIFTRLQSAARSKDISVIIEGTNLDDTKVYRPGIRALRELGIRSPFVEAEFTKEDVRRLAAEMGLSCASKPSAPCMATRFPYNTKITNEKLKKVEDSENYLRSLGFEDLRLRIHDNIARIEVPQENFNKILENKSDIIGFLKKQGYNYVTLDLQGFRSGSMDEV